MGSERSTWPQNALMVDMAPEPVVGPLAFATVSTSQTSKLFGKRRSALRFIGKNKMGFYPLPLSEAQRIRRFVQFIEGSSSAIDPCAGDGVAFDVITNDAEVFVSDR
jgi:hypothetical protein